MNGLQRIQAAFTQSKAFVGYLTAGDGGMKRTLKSALALIDGGVNILEIGVPFSDPIADGPVIQRAAARALAGGASLQSVLWLVENIRKKSAIPLILFSYLNPILSALHSSFFSEVKAVGIDGILLVDGPIEECQSFHEQCLQNNLAPILVIATSSPPARIRLLDECGGGFLYYACRKGTTGIRSSLPDDFIEKMQTIKSQVRLPVVTGFGIADRDAAKKVLRYADGVVVGSLFVKALEDNISLEELTRLAQSINPLNEIK